MFLISLCYVYVASGLSLGYIDKDITRSVEIDPNNIWMGYGQEIIGRITVTEDMKYFSGIDLKKIGETNPISNNQQSPSSSSGSGGGGGSSSPGVTNIYNSYIVQPKEDKEEKIKEEQTKEDLTGVTGAALSSITGAAVAELSKASPLVGMIIIIIIVLVGIGGYVLIKRRK